MARRASRFFTIGYEQAGIDAVIAELKRAGVKLLVDIRAVAASRRPGFSKRQLAAALDQAGIAYLHLRKLGTPAEGREAARAGDYPTLWRIYEKHLRTADAAGELDEVTQLVRAGPPLCLLCYERDVNHCHRRRVAELLSERTGARADNLVPAIF
ncbi:MAG: DUF488 domain-containing protein [Pseudorhodoplanes sp.]|nr:DUF488 domain-containing protein [Pseudorhodoplanes sp.]